MTGGILAVALNIFMVQAFALTPLAWYVIPIAMVISVDRRAGCGGRPCAPGKQYIPGDRDDVPI